MILTELRKAAAREGRALLVLLAIVLAYGLGSVSDDCFARFLDAIQAGGAE